MSMTFKEAIDKVPEGSKKTSSPEKKEYESRLLEDCITSFRSAQSTLQFEDYFKLSLLAAQGMAMRQPFQSTKSMQNKGN